MTVISRVNSSVNLAALPQGREFLCRLLRRPPRARLCAPGCLLLLLALPAAAHLPEPFGREFVREPEAPAAAAAPAGEPRPSADDERSALETMRELAALEEALEELEFENGAYGGALTDPLLQVAAMQERGGNPLEALRHLERAVHVLRINNGLLHPAQLPILRRLPDLYRQIGDLESAQRAWRYAYRVNGLGVQQLDDAGLRDALAYFQFVRDAFIAPGSGREASLLMQAFQDNEELYERLRDDADADPETLLAVAMSHLRNLYIVLGIDLTGAAGPLLGDAGSRAFERMYSLQTLALGRGMEILDSLDARYADAGALQRARLQLERANWLQWNSKWGRARDGYAVTLTLLDAAGQAGAAEEDAAAAMALRARLAEPAVLPEDSQLWQSLLGDEMPRRGVLSASFVVSARGNVSDIAIEPVGDTSATLAGRLRRLLRDSHFRPALFSGGPQEARVSGRRYRLIR